MALGCEMSVTTGPCPEGLSGDASKALVLTKAYKAQGGSCTDYTKSDWFLEFQPVMPVPTSFLLECYHSDCIQFFVLH